MAVRPERAAELGRRSEGMAIGIAWLTAPWAALRRRGHDTSEDERRAIAASGLFDLSHYLIQAPDVQAAGIDPIEHFCAFGWREGRRPNPCFDPAWYGSLYLPSAPQTNPLLHYIRSGEGEGCRPVAYFDPTWYRRAYALPRGTSALAHYLAHRRTQRVAPNAYFDLDYYLARHGEEIGPNRDPFAHLLRCGATRDLDPSASFDSRAYRAAKMPTRTEPPADLAAHERQVPLVHFLEASARAAAGRSG